MLPKKVVFDERETNLIRTVTQSGWRGRTFILALLATLLWGAYAYFYQLQNGLGATGMRDYVSWGMYITNFVFFIGISHVGALMSAILRLTHAEWRRPITRMAEVITFSSLFFGALMPFIDLGRPDRILNLFLYPQLNSPLVWDILCITTYLFGSTIFLFLPMIPDIALLRDGLQNASGWRRFIYRVLSFNWKDSPRQHARLERSMNIMAVIIIPIAVSVHTVVSWIFGMTLRAGWNSTIFGPYFVAGALASGAASVIVAMFVFRRFYHLEAYITLKHFRNMVYLALALDIIYIYFNIAEYTTMGFKMEEGERGLLTALFGGQYALAFWLTQIGGLILPAFLFVLPNIGALEKIRRARLLQPIPLGVSTALTGIVLMVLTSTSSPKAFVGVDPTLSLNILSIAVTVLAAFFLVSLLPLMRANPIATWTIASSLVVGQAWIKRYLIIVPTLQYPYLPIQNVTAEWSRYIPSWVEISITAGALAGFVLLYTLFSKVFPIVSIWETREGHAPVQEPTKVPARENALRGVVGE